MLMRWLLACLLCMLAGSAPNRLPARRPCSELLRLDCVLPDLLHWERRRARRCCSGRLHRRDLTCTNMSTTSNVDMAITSATPAFNGYSSSTPCQGNNADASTTQTINGDGSITIGAIRTATPVPAPSRNEDPSRRCAAPDMLAWDGGSAAGPAWRASVKFTDTTALGDPAFWMEAFPVPAPAHLGERRSRTSRLGRRTWRRRSPR